MEKIIKGLKIEPMKEPQIIEIQNDLTSLSKEVGGGIQTVYPFSDNACIICNDEGKMKGLEFNRSLRDESENVVDTIAGPMLIIGVANDDFCSLTDAQIIKYEDLFHTPEVMVNVNGEEVIVPASPDVWWWD